MTNSTDQIVLDEAGTYLLNEIAAATATFPEGPSRDAAVAAAHKTYTYQTSALGIRNL